MAWKCPECGSTDLHVVVEAMAKLTQGEDGEFETEIDGGSHDWDGGSSMVCKGCDFVDDAAGFEVDTQNQTNERGDDAALMDIMLSGTVIIDRE